MLPATQVNPCIDPTSPQSKLPWCDDKLPIDERVKDMVGRIPLKEKLPLLDTGGSPVPSLGLSSYNWWSEASTGVASGRDTQTTKFAFPITTGMSFNRTLWKLTGAQIGTTRSANISGAGARLPVYVSGVLDTIGDSFASLALFCLGASMFVSTEPEEESGGSTPNRAR